MSSMIIGQGANFVSFKVTRPVSSRVAAKLFERTVTQVRVGYTHRLWRTRREAVIIQLRLSLPGETEHDGAILRTPPLRRPDTLLQKPYYFFSVCTSLHNGRAPRAKGGGLVESLAPGVSEPRAAIYLTAREHR